MRRISLLVLILALAIAATAQTDTLQLLNGKQLATRIHLNDSLEQAFYRNAKGKLHKLDYDEIFAYRDSSGAYRVFYSPDSLSDNPLSVQQMSYYVLGEQHALATRLPRKYFLGGFVTGAGSVFLMPALGLPAYSSPIAAIGAGVGVTQIPSKTTHGAQQNLLENQNYQQGFRVATERRRNRSIWLGIGLGLTTGLIATLSLQ